MMRSAAILLMTTVALPAAAQAPDANTQAILDALKGINTRLDTIEQRIDRVEGQTPAAAPAATPAPAAALAPAATPNVAAALPDQADPSAPPPGMTVQPGWLIGVLPFEKNNPEPAALFYFPSKSAFTLNDHMRSTSSDNWVRYKGEAKFNAYTPGRYQFSINVTAGPIQTSGRGANSRGINCWGYFKANDQQIASIGDNDTDVKIPTERTQSFSGAIDLEEGNYDLAFRVSCTPNRGDFREGPQDYFTENLDRMWRATKVTVTVRTPQDLSPRPFTPRELFFFAPEEATVQAGTSAPAPGDRRNLLSGLNVRRTASTTAPIAAKLAPGDALEVVSVTPDQEWVEVSMNGRTLGFVKVTALNTNSR